MRVLIIVGHGALEVMWEGERMLDMFLTLKRDVIWFVVLKMDITHFVVCRQVT